MPVCSRMGLIQIVWGCVLPNPYPTFAYFSS
jgi:hypothetical protein